MLHALSQCNTACGLHLASLWHIFLHSSAWLIIWVRCAVSPQRSSRVHQAAPAEAHLVQGVEHEGVPERQDRPGQGPEAYANTICAVQSPLTEQRASPCSAGSARLRWCQAS